VEQPYFVEFEIEKKMQVPHFVKHTAKAPDIEWQAVPIPVEAFWRHVNFRAADGVGAAISGCQLFCQSKVNQLDIPMNVVGCTCEHNIARFAVSPYNKILQNKKMQKGCSNRNYLFYKVVPRSRLLEIRLRGTTL